ncbi:MAG: AraC family transcriptional regulator [Oscillospiraceae bacterium]|nr:AraC family transcriptional regulator [Oscillospiraceae bacterium]
MSESAWQDRLAALSPGWTAATVYLQRQLRQTLTYNLYARDLSNDKMTVSMVFDLEAIEADLLSPELSQDGWLELNDSQLGLLLQTGPTDETRRVRDYLELTVQPADSQVTLRAGVAKSLIERSVEPQRRLLLIYLTGGAVLGLLISLLLGVRQYRPFSRLYERLPAADPQTLPAITYRGTLQAVETLLDEQTALRSRYETLRRERLALTLDMTLHGLPLTPATEALLADLPLLWQPFCLVLIQPAGDAAAEPSGDVSRPPAGMAAAAPDGSAPDSRASQLRHLTDPAFWSDYLPAGSYYVQARGSQCLLLISTEPAAWQPVRETAADPALTPLSAPAAASKHLPLTVTDLAELLRSCPASRYAGISQIRQGPAQLPRALVEAQTALHNGLQLAQPVVTYQPEKAAVTVELDPGELWQLILNESQAALAAYFEQLIARLQPEGNTDSLSATVCYYNIISVFQHIAANLELKEPPGFFPYQVRQSVRANFSRLAESGELLRRQAAAQKGQGKYQQARQALAYIRKHYRNPSLSLLTVAEAVGLSERYLSALLTEATGASYHEWLSRLRRDKAQQLLTQSEQSVKEIALLVGYDNVNTFYKAFRKWTGLTPLQYRRSFGQATAAIMQLNDQ